MQVRTGRTKLSWTSRQCIVSNNDGVSVSAYYADWYSRHFRILSVLYILVMVITIRPRGLYKPFKGKIGKA
jgi:hypothetical protein